MRAALVSLLVAAFLVPLVTPGAPAISADRVALGHLGTLPALSESTARAYLEDRGLAGVDLAYEGVFEGLALRSARFHQTVAGLPVEGTRAQVTVDSANVVRWVIADVEPDLAAAPCHGMGGPAVQAAKALFPGPLWKEPRAEHLVNHLGETVWRVTILPHEPIGAWRVEVSCAGDVIRAFDGARYYDAKAKIYPASPIVAAADPDMRDNPAGSGLLMSDLRVEVPLLSLSSAFLQGKYAWIATPLATASDGATLDFDRGDPRFEDVNAYFWIDWAQRHIQSLGFDHVHNHTATIVPRLPGAYTAFYTGDPGMQMFFGYHAPPVIVTYGIEHLTVGSKNGVADAAEDANVILHEYGHAVLDYQAGICCTEEAAAMHEAFGDWQGASMLTRWQNGTAEGCMAPWFGSYLKDPDGAYPCYRDLNNDVTMDDWIPGDDPHFNQLIWSGALWKTQTEFMKRDGRDAGAAAFERIMFESNFLLPVEATLKDGVKAMLLADGAQHAAANRDLLAAEFLARKIIAPPDVPAVADLAGSLPADVTPTEQPLAIPAPALAAVVALSLVATALRRR